MPREDIGSRQGDHQNHNHDKNGGAEDVTVRVGLGLVAALVLLTDTAHTLHKELILGAKLYLPKQQEPPCPSHRCLIKTCVGGQREDVQVGGACCAIGSVDR